MFFFNPNTGFSLFNGLLGYLHTVGNFWVTRFWVSGKIEFHLETMHLLTHLPNCWFICVKLDCHWLMCRLLYFLNKCRPEFELLSHSHKSCHSFIAIECIPPPTCGLSFSTSGTHDSFHINFSN